MTVQTVWAIEWHSKNNLDGDRRFLIGPFPHYPDYYLLGLGTLIFRTRKQAREHIKKYYSEIAKREDLRSEPHGWRMPKPVKVTIEVTK